MKEGLGILLWTVFIFRQAFSQSPDFLSYSCGASSNFTDTSTGILWTSDTTIQTAGSTSNGSSSFLRYFPLSNNKRNLNCYDIPLSPGSHLTRATFTYGNYDKLNKPPSFQFVMNQTVVSTVNLSANDPWIEEFVWNSPGTDTTSFCLLAISENGVPVISSLEIRSLKENTYNEAAAGRILVKAYRINCGETSRTIRYPNDTQDRIWDKDMGFIPSDSKISTYGGPINTSASTPPLSVLQTSRVASGNSLSYVLSVPNRTEDIYHIFASFAMLSNTTTQTAFDILANGKLSVRNLVLPGSFFATSASFNASNSSQLNITLSGIVNSPEINGLEVYFPIAIAPPTTDSEATLLKSFSSYYTIELGDRDPCLPIPWNGIKCTKSRPPHVESLDLSSSGLKGSVSSQLGDFSELTHLNLSHNQLSGIIPFDQWDMLPLETLDLSYNQLSGMLSFEENSLRKLKQLNLQNNSLSGVLDSLVKLQALESVNIENNNFSGQIPESLKEKIQFAGNPCLGSNSLECIQSTAMPPSPSPETGISFNIKSKNQTGKIAGIAAASAVAAILLLSIAFLACRKKWSSEKTFSRAIRTGSRDFIRCKEFSYKELSSATNGFRSELGKGSFGPVYHGRLGNGQEVAIKVRSDASQLGADAFINEVSLLSRVHHQNLVELVGFCQKPKKQLLVYEFMPGGTLMEHLYGSKSPLDWKTRVRIAVGAATALDYLHNGSDSKIIHRDVKSSNILLDSMMNPKVADFGLSKHVASADATHITTMVKGTAGYLDPEYYASNQLTEKSDVYSFGVVLLELICGREPLSDSVPPDQYSIIVWARPHLLAGSYDEVVDRNVLGRYGSRSMAIVASVAAKSVARNPSERPKTSEVLRDLKEALEFENE